jgi:predicted Zn-dependent protease
MELLDGEVALDAARDIIARSGADETEVTVESVTDRFVRYADEGPTQCGDRDRVDVSIRVRLRSADGGVREARARCGSIEGDRTDAALARALALAEASPARADLPPMGGPVDVQVREADPETVAHSFDEKAVWVGRAVERCSAEGFQPAGLAETGAVSLAIANSAGRGVRGSASRASFALTASGAGGSGWAEAIVSRVGELDYHGVVDRAVAKAVASREPAPVEAGRYTVVLEPAAVSSLLLFAGYQGFGAREVHEESSFLCGRVGKRPFSELLTLQDDAANEMYPGLPFDGEGTPKSTVPLVESGLLHGPVTDRLWASRTGAESTGHANPQPSEHGPEAKNLVVARGEQSLDELVAGVERGLLVTQFHYTNVIEPRDMVLTGMTRNGTFLIEDGRVVGAVRNLRFTQSLVEALANVTGVGSDAEVAGALFDGEIVSPPLRIDGFRFTSTTDF